MVLLVQEKAVERGLWYELFWGDARLKGFIFTPDDCRKSKPWLGFVFLR
jgi:hypothetical protein